MSLTYSAQFKKSNKQPLHDEFLKQANRDWERRTSPGRNRHAFETTCPFCGEIGELIGKIRLGTSYEKEEVRLTTDGYEPDHPDYSMENSELLYIECQECGSAVQPIAYFSPSVFARNHRPTKGRFE